jgi:hypothetical protein
MAKYEYIFFRPDSTEDIAATFSTDEPLPHIQVGNSLLLETRNFSSVAGFHQVIAHIETYLFAPQDSVETIRMSVFLRCQDRAEILRQ